MDPIKVVTGMVRFSFPNVFTPKAGPDGGKEKYGIALLIPKSDKKTVAAIKAAIDKAYKEGVATVYGGKAPSSWNNPLRDGDEEREGEEEFAGMYFMNASSIRKPYVVDGAVQPIIDPAEFYPGCWGKASINFYPYNWNKIKKGVGAGLNGVQKLEDGERLGGGGSTAEDDFGPAATDGII